MKNRKTELRFPVIMEDVRAAVNLDAPRGALGWTIQETRQDQRPARMVGFSSLDLAQSGMEASQDSQLPVRRRGGRE